MRKPRGGEWVVGSALGMSLAAPVVMTVGAWARGLGRGMELIGLAMLYGSCAGALLIGLNFRYPLRYPDSWWGVFGPRQVPRMRLRRLMLTIALEAPLLALGAAGLKELGRSDRAFRQQQIDRCIEHEQANLQRAEELERKAAELRARAAPREGSAGGPDLAKSPDAQAKFWREQAAWARGMRQDWEAKEGPCRIAHSSQFLHCIPHDAETRTPIGRAAGSRDRPSDRLASSLLPK
jgi:hypothetical protein